MGHLPFFRMSMDDTLRYPRLFRFQIATQLSKAHFQRQLNVTAVPGSREPAGIGTDNSVTICWVVNEVCAVQDVEKLRPELQIPGFTQKRERGVLVHGEVPVQQAGPGQTSPRH